MLSTSPAAPSGILLTFMGTTKISLGNGAHTCAVNFAPLISPFLLPLALWLYRFKKTGKRNEIFLATKFGFGHGDPSKILRGDPEYVREALNKSLLRLGVDCVDLYYAHRADPAVPIEHTVAAMAELVR